MSDTAKNVPVRTDLSWLVRLRWLAVAGQIVTVAVAAWGLGIALPLLPLFGLIGLAAASNALAAWRLSHGAPGGEAILGVLLTFDTALLTGLLYWSGGPYNPFSVLYLVHVTLAAVALPPLWTGSLAALSVAAFGLLFPFHHSLESLEGHGGHAAEGLSLHLQGMWIAFALAAALIAVFVARLSRALREHQLALQTFRERAAQSERMASLATLAAGAAHELGTPLGTIAVAAKELERILSQSPQGAALAEDAKLIRAQAARCRGILDQMAADGGELPLEESAPVHVGDILRDVVESLPAPGTGRVRLHAPGQELRVALPRRSLRQALSNVLRNALDADTAGQSVDLEADSDGDSIYFEVRDRGPGMATEVLARVGEPFFTTKPAGSGMGLGLFLARSLIERLGGSLLIQSTLGAGTTVRFQLPWPNLQERGR